MTTPSALERPMGVPFARRLAARLVLVPAVVLSLLPPRHVRAVLGLVRRGAVPASAAAAANARDAMCAVSLRCAGPRGCLPRSLGAALLCRLGGTWPTWCTGVRVVPPFTAHAWIEADGRPVGEGLPDDYFTRLMAIGPVGRSSRPSPPTPPSPAASGPGG
ncbi:lasso peptide biosynthesis B2 protein [Streptomyces ficellus]|uniref:Lasso peptide biosynthesis B2 protein n=1 Tax=Streptomyces ficellus TaxID=1977088 RepID=A0ABT7ZEE4_9ACTN|nr:lasso peptide biosynthesis B2 protein [Streptomyces ficellus]MDN3297892.1 lasso peptide biosynthesis B2 protein [Streptomyces ficellus]